MENKIVLGFDSYDISDIENHNISNIGAICVVRVQEEGIKVLLSQNIKAVNKKDFINQIVDIAKNYSPLQIYGDDDVVTSCLVKKINDDKK